MPEPLLQILYPQDTGWTQIKVRIIFGVKQGRGTGVIVLMSSGHNASPNLVFMPLRFSVDKGWNSLQLLKMPRVSAPPYRLCWLIYIYDTRHCFHKKLEAYEDAVGAICTSMAALTPLYKMET